MDKESLANPSRLTETSPISPDDPDSTLSNRSMIMIEDQLRNQVVTYRKICDGMRCQKNKYIIQSLDKIDMFLNVDNVKETDLPAFFKTIGRCKFYSVRLFGAGSDYKEEYYLGHGFGNS